jgi:hypothetical protein
VRLRSLATATALAVAVVPFLTSSALSADATVGDALVPAPTSSTCGGMTYLMTGTASPSYTVPADGVITSWRTSTYAGSPAVTRTFKIARASGAGTYIFGAQTPPLSIPTSSADQTVSQSIRVPARAGDVIGLSSTVVSAGAFDVCTKYTDNGNDVAQVFTGDARGTASALSPDGFSGFRVSVAATLEADADKDGYGDTTQDRCPTDATTQGACPVVKDTAAPQTTVVSAKAAKAKIKATKPGRKKRFKKAEVTVAFAANETSTYTCSVDGGAFTACASPFTAKLKKGTHTIAVRATDAAGNVDTTPAATTVTVTKAKNKKSKKDKKKP